MNVNFQRVFKYPIDQNKILREGKVTIDIPLGGRVLSICKQNGKPVMYVAFTDTTEDIPSEKVEVAIMLTGHYYDNNILDFEFIATLMYGEYNEFVEHYFYRYADREIGDE
jgi:hypothetical protein